MCNDILYKIELITKLQIDAAVPIATFVLFLDNFQMTFLLSWASHVDDKYASKGNTKGVEWTQIVAGIRNKVLLSFIVGLGFVLGVNNFFK